MTISDFMNDFLVDGIDGIFNNINSYIFESENIDLNHVYIDGTKLEENANKYSWVWKNLYNQQKQSVYISNTTDNRNSYSKTDQDATFMRNKRDYMGNDQLLPSYNIQTGVIHSGFGCSAIHIGYGVLCFAYGKFNKTYGFYPEYPVADAGSGSYNNYLYCEQKERNSAELKNCSNVKIVQNVRSEQNVIKVRKNE